MDLAKLKDDLRRDECVRLKPYKDSVGKLSIGAGRNLDDVGISPAEADLMLTNDIIDATRSLDIGFPIWKTLSDARQRALVNMVFNMGLNKFLGFKKMLDAIRDKDFETASKEALDSTWAAQVGSRAERIANLLKNG